MMTIRVKTLVQPVASILFLGLTVSPLPVTTAPFQLVEAESKTSQDDFLDDDFYFIDLRQDYRIKTSHKEYGKNSGIYYTKNAKLSSDELEFYAETLQHLDKFWGGKKVLGDDSL